MKISLDVIGHQPDAVEGQKQAKLVDAAQQFEATMLQELLKPLQHGQDSWGGDAKIDDGGSDAIGSFGTESIAKAIAKAGGFGMAKQIVSKVTMEHDRNSEKRSI